MRRLLEYLIAALLFASPVCAASDPQLVTTGAKTGGISPQNGNYTGPTTPQAIIAYVVTSGSARTGSFGGAPAVGDLLVAGCYGTNNPVDAVAGTGWTAISSSVSGANTRGRLWTYLYVVTPSVTSYTPCTNPATGTAVGTVIFDLSGANAIWTNAFQTGSIIDVAANSTGPASCNTTTSKANTIALAFGASDTNGSTPFTDMTFTGLTTGKVTPGNSTTNNYAAGAYGSFRYPGSSVVLTTSGVWTGGAGGSATICDIILISQ